MGNVGVGTTDPTEKLHVAGNTKVDGDLYVAGETKVEGNIGTSKGIYSTQTMGLNIVPLGVIAYNLNASDQGAVGANFISSSTENIVGSLYNGSNQATLTIGLSNDTVDGKLFLNSQQLEGYHKFFITTNTNILQADTDFLSMTSPSSIYEVTHEIKQDSSNLSFYLNIHYELDSLDGLNVKGTVMVYGVH